VARTGYLPPEQESRVRTLRPLHAGLVKAFSQRHFPISSAPGPIRTFPNSFPKAPGPPCQEARKFLSHLRGADRNRTDDGGFADLCLTTWLRRLVLPWDSTSDRRKALKLAHLRGLVNASPGPVGYRSAAAAAGWEAGGKRCSEGLLLGQLDPERTASLTRS
jgi:hypothetical protein